MIPTMILFGLVFGRWWRTSLVAAAIGWTSLLLATGVVGFEPALLAAALLAVANAGVGVLVHQAGLRVYRHLRRGADVSERHA